MDMENVERLRFPDLRHLHGERQRVIGAGKHRCVADFDFMEMDSRQTQIEPDWLGVAEEVDVGSARSQFGSQRRRQDSASADKRKTGDPDFERSFHQSPIYARPESEISSRSTNVTPGASASFRYSRSPAPAP